jgi:hypothetical protein
MRDDFRVDPARADAARPVVVLLGDTRIGVCSATIWMKTVRQFGSSATFDEFPVLDWNLIAIPLDRDLLRRGVSSRTVVADKRIRHIWDR